MQLISKDKNVIDGNMIKEWIFNHGRLLSKLKHFCIVTYNIYWLIIDSFHASLCLMYTCHGIDCASRNHNITKYKVRASLVMLYCICIFPLLTVQQKKTWLYGNGFPFQKEVPLYIQQYKMYQGIITFCFIFLL